MTGQRGAGGRDEDAIVRPRRSCLYMPGTNARAHEKARGLAADVLIFDLEDSVAPGRKAEARTAVAAALAAGGYGVRELVVRVNSLGTPWGEEDLRMAAAAGASAALVTKADGPEEIRRAGAILDAGTGTTALWSMMETARGVLAAEAMATAHPRLAVLAMGLEDLVKELRADAAGDRRALLYALERTVLVARAFGLGVLDGVHRALGDAAGFAAACAEGRALGFDGKQLIHPDQIAPANAAFTPGPEAVAEARRMIAAFEEASRAGDAVAVLDGRMVEALHVAEARRVIAFAEAIAARAGKAG
jgi:citrate lyase subunit beta/citryl-CoA lyase